MASGFQVFNESGVVMLDISTIYGQFIGRFYTYPYTPGSTVTFTDTKIIGKTFFYYCASSDDFGGPTVTANTSTGEISWYFSSTIYGSGSPGRGSYYVYYGVY